jgi:PiT family inorganic phosphate transporter
MLETNFYFIVFIIVIALVFDFINGLHDAANSIATIVSTRVMKPKMAVIWAAFFNFVAFLFFGVHVAKAVGKGVIDPSIVDSLVVLSALMGAIIWNIITWYYGIPSSSSHALIGGIAGAGIAKAGFKALVFDGIFKISVSIILSPLLGAFLGMLFMFLLSIFLFKSSPLKVDTWFRRLQFVSASLYSLGHGGNDAQKIMGIITVLLFSNGLLGSNFDVPLWVVISCHLAMGLGTLMGGWRIVKTMGIKITKLKPIGGFCAETAGALTLFLATQYGVPVSTTHTITGSIMGVGSLLNLKKVNWKVAQKIVMAWILTIPASSFIAGLFYFLIKKVF